MKHVLTALLCLVALTACTKNLGSNKTIAIAAEKMCKAFDAEMKANAARAHFPSYPAFVRRDIRVECSKEGVEETFVFTLEFVKD